MPSENETIEEQTEQPRLRDTAAEVGHHLRDLGSQVREKASHQYNRLREKSGDYYSRGRERAMAMEQSLEQHVQEKPIQSLLIAAGIGVLLGMLWKRR